MVAKFFAFSVLSLLFVFSILLSGCASEPDFSVPEEKRNVSAPPGTKYEFYNCSAPFECWDLLGRDYSCYNFPDWQGYSGVAKCGRRLEGNCSFDSECGATEACLKGLCWKINSLEIPKNVSLGMNASQEEPPIMLSCESDSDCPGWQYVRYRCRELFKYGKVCVANRAGGISGKTPGCTNDASRDLSENAVCVPEDKEFCVNGQPYITTCPSEDWCVDKTYCVRKR
ncbi:hypothetical protein HY992_05955 [Candidatus Micrarchaeota archaeon]|nr:hypothetical protein [Candidatus Micrarchaeota archaeon]